MKHLLILISAIIFSCAKKEKQPNLVFIPADDMGWDPDKNCRKV